MISTVTISLTSACCFQPNDFTWLRKRFPRFWYQAFAKGQYAFHTKFRPNSPDYRECLAYLEQIGLKPMPPEKLKLNSHPDDSEFWRGYYLQQVEQKYTTKDFVKCELIWFFLDRNLSEGCGEETDGTPYIDMGDLANEGGEDGFYDFLDGNLRIFDLLHNRIGVSDEGKRLLEASGLTGFCITRRLRVTGDRSDEVQATYWLVDVPLALPLSVKTSWERPSGEIYTGSWEPGVKLHDAHDSYSFDRAAIQSAGAFDLATWQPGAALPRKLGTNRWFKFCKENKIKCDWTPLKVVE